ncbi:MAG: helix-turn-helix domain-containing protein [candidate division WOR-3 bacterium]|nr:helix-turn-helix domain-containing protein [candidate division WOR-3 bacterium]
MQNIPLINYKELRKINPQNASQSVIEYLKSTGNNISHTAKAFGINRSVVYDIIDKFRQGNLKDRPKTPLHQLRKTDPEIETKVVAMKTKIHLGPKRLSRYL